MNEKSKQQPDRLPVTLSIKAREHIETLVNTGAFGSRDTDVAKTLIEQGIRKAIQEGFIVKKTEY